MRATCYVVDRQIDEAVGFGRCVSHGMLKGQESSGVIGMAESYIRLPEDDDKKCWEGPII